MSAGLDAEQVATARLDLTNVTNQRVFPVLLETAVFAFLSVLICMSSYLLISKGLHDRPNRIMFALTLVVYALSATQWGIDVAIMWNDLNKLIPLDLTGVEGTAPTNNRNFYIQFAEDPLGALNFILADCVALWRACAVWGMRKGMVISSAIIVVILVGSWVVFLVAQAAQSLPSAPASIQVWTDSNTIIALETFSYTFTAAANILPTAMIAYKAWSVESWRSHHHHDATDSFT
ncbi:hypothetical protein OF83DRAFT_1176123 [Amylostereum chailletii]|nr:hypothetical protein OF83DRAFT_1176123 [Amylostereum chailletii]